MTLKIFLQPLFHKILISYFLFSILVFVFIGNQSKYHPFPEFLYLVTFFLQLYAARSVVKSFGVKHPQGRAFFTISLGLTSTAVGQTLWFILHSLLGKTPDVITAPLYFIGYALVFIGFILEIKAIQVHWRKIRSLILIAVLLLGFFLIFLVFKVEMFPILTAQSVSLVKLINLSYVLSDICLIILSSFILFLIVEYRGGSFCQCWLFLLTGQFLILIGDIFFAAFNIPYSNDIWPYTLINLIWLMANLSIAFGASSISSSINFVQKRISNSK